MKLSLTIVAILFACGEVDAAVNPEHIDTSIAQQKFTGSVEEKVGQRELQAFNDYYLNCNSDSVVDWVHSELNPNSCSSYNIAVRKTCRKYQKFESIYDCFFLLGQPSNSSIFSSAVEECEFWVSELLPDDFFRDVDGLHFLFGSSGEFPTDHKCRKSDRSCQVKVLFEEDDPTLILGTLAPTQAPYIVEVPCVKCDYFYADDDTCFDASCTTYNCVAPEEQENFTGTNTNTPPSSVAMCASSSRSDTFSYTEYRKGIDYVCAMRSEEKIYTTEFHLGVNNILNIELQIGELYTRDEIIPDDDSENDKFDFCKVTVDDEECNSCKFCELLDISNLAVDCSNIVPGAITSCDSVQDAEHGIIHKLVVLEEGYTRPPTPTSSPTSSPTFSPPFSPRTASRSGAFSRSALNANRVSFMTGFGITVIFTLTWIVAMM